MGHLWDSGVLVAVSGITSLRLTTNTGTMEKNSEKTTGHYAITPDGHIVTSLLLSLFSSKFEVFTSSISILYCILRLHHNCDANIVLFTFRLSFDGFISFSKYTAVLSQDLNKLFKICFITTAENRPGFLGLFFL